MLEVKFMCLRYLHRRCIIRIIISNMLFFNIQILSSLMHVAVKNMVTACKITLHSYPVSNTWFEDSTKQKCSSYNPENLMYLFYL